LYSNNVRVKGDRIDVMCPQKWTSTETQPPYIVGEEVKLHAST